MKILSIVVPCYNSEAYMKKCIESLLVGGDDVEIIIVDDGSSDNTSRIADLYQAEYPEIIKAVHQENGGHGDAVNTGLHNATGIYFKVVDSDDWVNEQAYKKILGSLKRILAAPDSVDMVISNFVYEKQGVKRKKIMHYRSALPKEQIFTWNQVKKFCKGQYILMHSVIYRTKLLLSCGLELPKHTFYVDNLFVFKPLPYVETMYYVDVNFYRYFIGRDDQSVNETVMIRRIDQQIRVNKMMIDTFLEREIQNNKLRKYMINYLDIITTVSSIMLICSGTKENLGKKEELWKYLRNSDKSLYRKIRFSLLGNAMNLPGKVGRGVSLTGYKVAKKFFGFN
jgi:Glycosyltransferases involved in cell wall biogenesis